MYDVMPPGVTLFSQSLHLFDGATLPMTLQLLLILLNLNFGEDEHVFLAHFTLLWPEVVLPQSVLDLKVLLRALGHGLVYEAHEGLAESDTHRRELSQSDRGQHDAVQVSCDAHVANGKAHGFVGVPSHRP